MKIGLVSTYYPSLGGVATYANYFFNELEKINDQVYILTDKVSLPEKEKNSKIVRCWDHNYHFVRQILKAVKDNNIQIVHFQQELHLFGGLWTAVLLPYLFLRLKLSGRKIVVTFHGVVNLKDVSRRFIEENYYRINYLPARFGLYFLYSALGWLADFVIVHEEKFKYYLKSYFIDQQKIKVIGHGVINQTVQPKNLARQKLGLKAQYTFLSFGYLTGYKGIETIISALKSMPEDDFNFLVVASPHPRLAKNKKYQEYYQKIKDYFIHDSRTRFFGYIPQDQLVDFFSASDCAVFPYTVLMSSSGPMALALGSENLLLASSAFSDFLPDSLIFKDQKQLAELMIEAKNRKLDQYREIIINKKDQLAWPKIAQKTNQLYQLLKTNE
jgi:glycosyltransferase involved in cell wall biosynthesis